MRQIFAYVPEGQGQRVINIAQSFDAINLASFRAETPDGPNDVVMIQTSNLKLDPLMDELEKFENLKVNFYPTGIIPLLPPANETEDQATDVTSKGALEIYLSGLQSIGSWKGFLGYAFAAGIVAWIGLYTGVVYLLVAAMLIAPFAGPAMTLAMGTARGDKTLIKRSLLRYFSSLVLTILTASGLSYLFGQQSTTTMMVDNSLISSTTMLLSVVAGAAGALALCQSERNSLVTAAGPGMLVAASLAPPAGVIGMAMAIGEWNIAKSGAFLLLNQLIGINISGAIIFTLFDLRPKGVRYDRGKNYLRFISAGASLLLVGAMLWWQFTNKPNLQRATQTIEVAQEVKKLIKESGLAMPVEVNARYTRANIPNQNSLIIEAYVQKNSGVEKDLITQRLKDQIKQLIRNKEINSTPFVKVNVFDP